MIEILNSKQIPLSKLTANNGQIEGIPKNPRFIKSERYQKLLKSIQDNPEFLGARELIVHEYNGKFVVLCGNMRYRAAKELGFDTLPAKVIPDTFTTEQIKAIIIKDNISFGDDDFDALANEWDATELEEWGFEFPDLGEDFEPEILEAQEDDYEMPEQMQVDVILGDLIEIGEHRLLCGDSTDSDQVAKLMNGEKADMVFTDPPYFSKQNLVREATPKALIKGSLMGKDSMFAKIYDFDEDKVITTLNTLFLFSEINTYFCCSQEQVVFYLKYAENLDLQYNILVWRKPNNVINKDRFSSSIEYIIRIYDKKNAGLNKLANNDYYDKVKEISRYISKDEKVHHTQKPIGLCCQFIELSSNINELLYEPFTGSGSTMVAAHQLKRKCYGMELDPKYCQVIIDRMRKLDPSLVIKINGQIYNK